MHRVAILAMLLISLTVQSPRPEWDDPAVLHVNTEKPHATMIQPPPMIRLKT